MGSSMTLKNLQTAGLIVVGLAIIVVMGIIVLEGFKDSSTTITPVNDTTFNTTVDQFITGLAIIGGFVGIIMLAIIGKIIVQLFKD